MSQSNPVHELVKKLADAAGWNIPETRMAEIAAIYKATADDTVPVRQADLTGYLPADIFEAE